MEVTSLAEVEVQVMSDREAGAPSAMSLTPTEGSASMPDSGVSIALAMREEHGSGAEHALCSVPHPIDRPNRLLSPFKCAGDGAKRAIFCRSRAKGAARGARFVPSFERGHRHAPATCARHGL